MAFKLSVEDLCLDSQGMESEDANEYDDLDDISGKLLEDCADLKQLASQFCSLSQISSETLANQARQIEQEFRIITKITNTNKHSEKLVEFTEEVGSQNRYSEVYPFAFNNVRLTSGEYINASYVTDTRDILLKKYIATQAPLKKGYSQFWRMVWESGSHFIVCLTGFSEKGTPKASKYWPEHAQELVIGDFHITLLQETDLFVSTRYSLELKREGKDETRKIELVHWHAWPDRGVPPDSANQALVELCMEVNSHFIIKKKPVIVHCSAGIGRTSTFIAIAEGISLLGEHKDLCAEISVFEVVRRLREQRWGAVQTIDQYKFIYQSLSLYKQSFVLESSLKVQVSH